MTLQFTCCYCESPNQFLLVPSLGTQKSLNQKMQKEAGLIQDVQKPYSSSYFSLNRHFLYCIFGGAGAIGFTASCIASMLIPAIGSIIGSVGVMAFVATMKNKSVVKIDVKQADQETVKVAEIAANVLPKEPVEKKLLAQPDPGHDQLKDPIFTKGQFSSEKAEEFFLTCSMENLLEELKSTYGRMQEYPHDKLFKKDYLKNKIKSIEAKLKECAKEEPNIESLHTQEERENVFGKTNELKSLLENIRWAQSLCKVLSKKDARNAYWDKKAESAQGYMQKLQGIRQQEEETATVLAPPPPPPPFPSLNNPLAQSTIGADLESASKKEADPKEPTIAPRPKSSDLKDSVLKEIREGVRLKKPIIDPRLESSDPRADTLKKIREGVRLKATTTAPRPEVFDKPPLLKDIEKGTKLKPLSEEVKQQIEERKEKLRQEALQEEGNVARILARRVGIEFSDSENEEENEEVDPADWE